MAQAKRQCAKRARHGRGIDHGQHRHAKVPGQVGRAGAAVKQPHHAFDEDQVRLDGGVAQSLRAVGLTVHPQIELVHRRPAGQLVPVRVQKIRPALENPHAPPLACVQARQGGGDGGLALSRGRGCNQQRGTACHTPPPVRYSPSGRRNWRAPSQCHRGTGSARPRVAFPLRGEGAQRLRGGFIEVPTSHRRRPCGLRWRRCGPAGSPCRPGCRCGPAACSRAQCGCWRTG